MPISDDGARDRLPPGQTLTKKFPVTGEKEPSPGLSATNWELVLDGEVDRPLQFSLEDIHAMPRQELQADIHCVTSWSHYDMRFTGIRFADLLGYGLVPTKAARFVRFSAYSSRGHDTSLPLADALDEAWLVHSVNGHALTASHGFPLRVIMPNRYFYKSLKWLHRITFLPEDQLGFWERTSGYHNHGDPWKEERFEGTRFTSAPEAAAFRSLSDFSPYRRGEGKVILKADFTGWTPETKRLYGLQLKACNFRDAQLTGADLRWSNLTLAKFGGAHLEGADLSGADLEGADFTGAYLAGARFHSNCLSATTFFKMDRNGRRQGLASFQGMEVATPDGLLESQSDYLDSIGVIQH